MNNNLIQIGMLSVLLSLTILWFVFANGNEVEVMSSRSERAWACGMGHCQAHQIKLNLSGSVNADGNLLTLNSLLTHFQVHHLDCHEIIAIQLSAHPELNHEQVVMMSEKLKASVKNAVINWVPYE